MKKFCQDIITIIYLSCIVVLAYSAGVWSYKTLQPPLTSLTEPGESSVGTFSRRPLVQTYLMRVSAYCPCEKCCGEHSDGTASSGKKVAVGMIAAPRCYPFGAVFIIKGKEYIVQDRGGAITADKFYHDGQLVYGRVDIFFESHQDALEWGVQYLPVEVK